MVETNMSSKQKQATRAAMLDAGLKLIARNGHAAVTLAAVAAAAGVSRQAVYLHFGSRAGFLNEAADHAWQKLGLPDPRVLVRDAASARAALRLLIELRARTAQELAPFQYVPGSDSAPDAALMEAYAQRQRQRLEVFVLIAKRAKAEGVLRSGVSVAAAAQLMWSVLSVPVWRSLVDLQGWSRRKFIRQMDDFLSHALFT